MYLFDLYVRVCARASVLSEREENGERGKGEGGKEETGKGGGRGRANRGGRGKGNAHLTRPSQTGCSYTLF